MKRLIDENFCDINYIPNNEKIKFWHSALTYCCRVPKGFDNSQPRECENYRIFEMLLSRDELDLSLENQDGENTIMLLQKYKSKDYLELLKSYAKSNKYSWSKKYTFEKIEKEIRANEVATDLADAAGLLVFAQTDYFESLCFLFVFAF